MSQPWFNPTPIPISHHTVVAPVPLAYLGPSMPELIVSNPAGDMDEVIAVPPAHQEADDETFGVAEQLLETEANNALSFPLPVMDVATHPLPGYLLLPEYLEYIHSRTSSSSKPEQPSG